MGTTLSSCVMGNQNRSFKGKPLTDMRNLFTLQPDELLNVEPGGDHAVLFLVPIKDVISAPSPNPPVYEDKWDEEHVKMPCSPKNLNQGKSPSEQNWTLIETAYKNKISNSIELEEAISSYDSSETVKLYGLAGLHKFLNEVITEEEKARFFNHTLPGIISLALRLPEIVTQPPVLLSRQKAQSISLSQLQIASLLANAFLTTFPHRNNTPMRRSELVNYPDVNFSRLFKEHGKNAMVIEKIRCILNYFDRVVAKEPTGTVTITRAVVKENEFPNWETAQETFGKLHISSEGTIEKEGDGLLQMDFSDPFIGGMILDWDCLQEEILFAIRPEMIVALLFTERLENNEALLITGCEKYCLHSGYSRTFRFEGDYIDTSPRDAYGRRLNHIVAIDATPYPSQRIQYEEKSFLRELNKAYAGFHSRKEGAHLAAIATGNWGCGVFNGDPRLKCLIQLMAAAVAGRDVAYFSFGDEQLRDDVFAMYTMLLKKRVTVGMLYKILCKYEEGPRDGGDLYENIVAVLLERDRG